MLFFFIIHVVCLIGFWWLWVLICVCLCVVGSLGQVSLEKEIFNLSETYLVKWRLHTCIIKLCGLQNDAELMLPRKKKVRTQNTSHLPVEVGSCGRCTLYLFLVTKYFSNFVVLVLILQLSCLTLNISGTFLIFLFFNFFCLPGYQTSISMVVEEAKWESRHLLQEDNKSKLYLEPDKNCTEPGKSQYGTVGQLLLYLLWCCGLIAVIFT